MVTMVMVPLLPVAWIVQGRVYVALSYVVHVRMSPARLLRHCGAQPSVRRWWSFLGAGRAESWTLGGGLLATLLVVLGARLGYFDGTAPPTVVSRGCRAWRSARSGVVAGESGTAGLGTIVRRRLRGPVGLAPGR